MSCIYYLVASLLGLFMSCLLYYVSSRLQNQLNIKDLFRHTQRHSHATQASVVKYIYLGRYQNIKFNFFKIFFGIAHVLLSMICFAHFGMTWQAIFSFLFSSVLLILTIIDIKSLLLPDHLTLPFLWLGIIANLFHLFTDINRAVLGAIIGYLSFWALAKLYKICRKVEGMGYGDFKMLALVGAWVGVDKLPYVVLFSSGLSLCITLLLIACGKATKRTLFPFAPYLAIGGWMMLFWREF